MSTPSFISNSGGVVGGIVGGVPDMAETPPRTSKLDPALQNQTGKAKVRIQVFLINTDAATLTALKQLGLEILAQPQSARMVIGQIEADKLVALSKLPAVTWIAPAR